MHVQQLVRVQWRGAAFLQQLQAGDVRRISWPTAVQVAQAKRDLVVICVAAVEPFKLRTLAPLDELVRNFFHSRTAVIQSARGSHHAVAGPSEKVLGITGCVGRVDVAARLRGLRGCVCLGGLSLTH